MGELHQLKRGMHAATEGIQAFDIDLSKLGSAFHKLFEQMREALPPRGGKFIITQTLRDEMARVHGEGFTAQFAVYDEPFVPHEPQGFKRLPNGRLMPIVQKGSGPKIDPVHRRGRRD